MKILIICLFGLLLASPILAGPSSFLQSLPDLYHAAASTDNTIFDEISSWVKAHISVAQSNADPLIKKINQSLLDYANAIRNLEKDKRKMYNVFVQKIDSSSGKYVQDISNLPDFLKKKAINEECMNHTLSLQITALDQINDCENNAMTKVHNMLLKLNNAAETLTKRAHIPLKYLEKCNMGIKLIKIADCNPRKINLFVEDLHVIISDVDRIKTPKTTMQFQQIADVARACMQVAVIAAKTSVVNLELADCSPSA